jgi:hypothetical protein
MTDIFSDSGRMSRKNRPLPNLVTGGANVNGRQLGGPIGLRCAERKRALRGQSMIRLD